VLSGSLTFEVTHESVVWEVNELQGDNAGLIVAEVELNQPYRASRLNGGPYSTRYFQHAEDYSGHNPSLFGLSAQSRSKAGKSASLQFSKTNSADGDNSVTPATFMERELPLAGKPKRVT
jgi:hypothetical protein